MANACKFGNIYRPESNRYNFFSVTGFFTQYKKHVHKKIAPASLPKNPTMAVLLRTEECLEQSSCNMLWHAWKTSNYQKFHGQLKSALESFKTFKHADEEANTDDMMLQTQNDYFDDEGLDQGMPPVYVGENFQYGSFAKSLCQKPPLVVRMLRIKSHGVGVWQCKVAGFLLPRSCIVSDISRCRQSSVTGYVISYNQTSSFLTHPAAPAISSYVATQSISTNLYHNGDKWFNDAHLAILSACLEKLCETPDFFQREWMTRELNDILLACVAARNKDFTKYCSVVDSEDFRLALIQQTDDSQLFVRSHHALNAWLDCPNVSKFMLAMFINHNCEHPDHSVDYYYERRKALIVEHFGRSCNTTYFDTLRNVVLDKTLFEKIINDTQEYLATSMIRFDCAQTMMSSLRERCPKITELKTIDDDITLFLIIFDPRVLAIQNFFQYLCPDLPAMDPGQLFTALHMSMYGKNSYVRMTLFVQLMNWKIGHVAKRFLNDINHRLWKQIEKTAFVSFKAHMAQLHRKFPVFFYPEDLRHFKEQFGRDLEQEFDIMNGVSTTCCMYPGCPFFKKKISPFTVSTHFKQYNIQNKLFEWVPNKHGLSDGLYFHYITFTHSVHQINVEINRAKNNPLDWSSMEGLFQGNYINILFLTCNDQIVDHNVVLAVYFGR